MIDYLYEFICMSFSFLITILLFVLFIEYKIYYSGYLMNGIFCLSYLIFRNTLNKEVFNSDLPKRYR